MYWLVIDRIFGQVEQIIGNYLDKDKNERLQKLCKLKNFKTWDQSQMREFLKYK
jgi:hypothetical protein